MVKNSFWRNYSLPFKAFLFDNVMYLVARGLPRDTKNILDYWKNFALSCQHFSIVFSKLSIVYYVTIDHTKTSALLALHQRVVLFCCSTCLLKVVVDRCYVFVISGKDFSVLGEFLSLLILMLYKQTFLIINFALQLTECDLSPALARPGPLGERKMF